METALRCKSGLFFRGLFATVPLVPPSQPSLQGNTVGRSSDPLGPASPFLQPQTCGPGCPCSSALGVSPPGLARLLSFCPILLGKHSSLQMVGRGPLLWCCRPLWSDGGEGGLSWCCRPFGQLVGRGLFSLWCCRPLGLPTGVPSLESLPLHRILPGLPRPQADALTSCPFLIGIGSLAPTKRQALSQPGVLNFHHHPQQVLTPPAPPPNLDDFHLEC